MIVLCIIAIGFSAAGLVLGTSIAWAESHAATPAQLVHLAILAFGSLGALGWVVMTPFRWRTRPMEIGALVAVATGQLSLWQLVRVYDLVLEWTIGPIILAAMAVISLAFAFGVFLLRPWLDRSKSRVDS